MHARTRRVIKRANDTVRMRGPECPRRNDTKVQCKAMCPQRRRYSPITTFASSRVRPPLTVHKWTIMIMMVMMVVVARVYWEHCDDDAYQKNFHHARRGLGGVSREELLREEMGQDTQWRLLGMQASKRPPCGILLSPSLPEPINLVMGDGRPKGLYQYQT